MRRSARFQLVCALAPILFELIFLLAFDGGVPRCLADGVRVADTSSGKYTSAVINPATGYPIVVYHGGSHNLLAIVCGDVDCSTDGGRRTLLSSANDVGANLGAAFDATNGVVRVAFHDGSSDVLKFGSCLDGSCSSFGSVRTLDSSSYDIGEWPSVAIGSDGFPIISYHDEDYDYLQTMHCTSANCATSNSYVIQDYYGGEYSSIAIGSNSVPVVAYYVYSYDELTLLICPDTACSVSGAKRLLSYYAGYQGCSVAIGSDGFPIVAFYYYVSWPPTYGSLRVAHCNDVSCSSFSTTTLDSSSSTVGKWCSIAIGLDGLAVISYYDETNGNLKMVHCTTLSCSSFDTPLVIDSSGNVGLYTSIVIDGEGFPFISYWDATNDYLKVFSCSIAVCPWGPSAPSLSSTRSASTTRSLSGSSTRSMSQTRTQTPSSTLSMPPSVSASSSSSQTPTPTVTPSSTLSAPPTVAAGITPSTTTTESASPSYSSTETPTGTPSPSESQTPSPSFSATTTRSALPTGSDVPTSSPTLSSSPSLTLSASRSSTSSPSPSLRPSSSALPSVTMTASCPPINVTNLDVDSACRVESAIPGATCSSPPIVVLRCSGSATSLPNNTVLVGGTVELAPNASSSTTFSVGGPTAPVVVRGDKSELIVANGSSIVLNLGADTALPPIGANFTIQVIELEDGGQLFMDNVSFAVAEMEDECKRARVVENDRSSSGLAVVLTVEPTGADGCEDDSASSGGGGALAPWTIAVIVTSVVACCCVCFVVAVILVVISVWQSERVRERVWLMQRRAERARERKNMSLTVDHGRSSRTSASGAAEAASSF